MISYIYITFCKTNVASNAYSFLRSCVQLFEDMGMGSLDVYSADFEKPLLESTRY